MFLLDSVVMAPFHTHKNFPLSDSRRTLTASFGSGTLVEPSANHVTAVTGRGLLITVRTMRSLKGSVPVHTHTHCLFYDETLTLA